MRLRVVSALVILGAAGCAEAGDDTEGGPPAGRPDGGDDVTPGPDAGGGGVPDGAPARPDAAVPVLVDAAPPPPDVGVTHACAYGFNEHEAPSTGSPELLVIGMYEGSSDHTIAAPVAVHVARPGHAVLVVSSYESVQWNVTAGPATTVDRVISVGYETQLVAAPAGTAVDDYSGPGGAWPGSSYEWTDTDTAELVSYVEGITGLSLRFFAGCYRSTSWTIY